MNEHRPILDYISVTFRQKREQQYGPECPVVCCQWQTKAKQTVFRGTQMACQACG